MRPHAAPAIAGPVRLDDIAGAVAWLHAHGATRLSADSRALPAGTALLAWPGARHDPRQQAIEAVQQGAPAALLEAEGAEAPLQASLAATAAARTAPMLRLAVMPGLRARSGRLADAFYGHPSRHLEGVAVTGTNGKTSVAWGVAQALAGLGRRCGIVGTLGVGEPATGLRPTGLTTPEAVALHDALHTMAGQGVRAFAIEASSIGLVEGRLDGLHLHTACFTHLTQDHLDYHGTMQAYWEAKQRLFDWEPLAAAVVHVGDTHGRELAERLARRRPDLRVWTVGRESSQDATLRIEPRDEPSGAGGQPLWLIEGDARWPLVSQWVGAYSRENLAVVAGALRSLGHRPEAVAAGLQAIPPVPGRLQPVLGAAGDDAPRPEVLVDYAHTPDALIQVLAALRPHARARGGRLWCVVGCGGNRDAGKRPLMAAAAEAGADRLVLTSDNPRDERPRDILDQMLAGLRQPAQATVIEDRAAAIAHAVAAAAPHDVVLLAGKGHETEQEIAGVRHPFSDAAEAARALLSRSRAGTGDAR